MKLKQIGFTTLELVTVLVVIAVLSALSLSRFQSNQSFKLQSARDDVVAAFSTAQQLSMVRSGGSELVQLQINANTLDVTIDSVNVNVGALTFPLTMPNSVTLSSTPVSSFSFDGLGNTTAATITITDTSSANVVTVLVESSGYVQ